MKSRKRIKYSEKSPFRHSWSLCCKNFEIFKLFVCVKRNISSACYAIKRSRLKSSSVRNFGKLEGQLDLIWNCIWKPAFFFSCRFKFFQSLTKKLQKETFMWHEQKFNLWYSAILSQNSFGVASLTTSTRRSKSAFVV